MFRIGTFTLTEDEVRKRKSYLEFAPADEERLRQAHPYLQNHATSIIDRFYEYLLGHEHTRAMLSAPGLVDRLKKLQAQYFIELTSGQYGIPYFENRLRVGQVHHRIGLDPEWYLGAYLKYLHIASDVLSTAFGRDYERFYQTLVSLTKVIYLDLGLALDAYHFTAQEVLETQNVEMARTNEQLRQLQAAKQQLTDMIVHDLQNPLTGIAAALQVLRSESASRSPSEREALEEALRRCSDLSQMIMNVLQVSRAEQGKLPTYLENLDLVPLAGEVVDTFRRVAELDGRAVAVEGLPSAPIRSDQTLIRRILQNLVRNALRHTPRGTRVVVRVDEVASGRFRLSVIDDGPGIAPDVQGHIFEPFGAAGLRGSGLRVDTGLGLPSCRAAARALGTEIVVQSDGRKGSTFSIEFPA